MPKDCTGDAEATEHSSAIAAIAFQCLVVVILSAIFFVSFRHFQTNPRDNIIYNRNKWLTITLQIAGLVWMIVKIFHYGIGPPNNLPQNSAAFCYITRYLDIAAPMFYAWVMCTLLFFRLVSTFDSSPGLRLSPKKIKCILFSLYSPILMVLVLAAYGVSDPCKNEWKTPDGAFGKNKNLYVCSQQMDGARGGAMALLFVISAIWSITSNIYLGRAFVTRLSKVPSLI